MIYVFILQDRHGAGELRQRMRPQHKAYLGQVAERIAFAGPLLSDDGHTMTGSLLAIDFEHREAAMAWLQEEPFTRAGLYAAVQVQGFSNLWPQKTGFPVPVIP